MRANGQPAAPSPAEGAIRIRGARVHNLKNVDVDIPRDQLVVVSGPSGSGKSSLAFDTLYAEGQRQYIESLSVYARQFLDQLERPDVDVIEGLQPTISIDQRAGSNNPRSTVATVTEIYDYLRVLYARAGEATCYKCGQPVRQQTIDQIQEELLALPEGTKAMILAPLVRGRKGRHGEMFAAARKAGFVRVRIDGAVYDMEQVPELEPRRNHHIEAVVDRVLIREGIRSRIVDSLGLAVRHGEGLVIVTVLDGEPAAETGAAKGKPTKRRAAARGTKGRSKGAAATPPSTDPAWRDLLFSTRYACPDCGVNLAELEPRTFSFNSPYGACADCEGLGARLEFDPDLVLADPELSLADGAIAPWRNGSGASGRKQRAAVVKFLESQGADEQTRLSDLPSKIHERLLRGDGKKFLGLLILLEQQYATATKAAARQKLETFRGEVVCGGCGGARLRPEARACRVAGRAIHEVTAMPVRAARAFFAELEFDETREPIAAPLVTEIERRLEFLERVGVEYLSLDRPADTLSGGEAQRVRLATGIGSGLVGVCYVLDEPTIGLHPRDNRRLIDALRDLQQQGNTVVVVEHDEAMIRAGDQLIDLGPAAGEGGGRIVAQGPPDDVSASDESVTGRYLSGAARIEVPARRRRTAKSRSLQLEGVTTNNLQQVGVRIPLGALVCVTGVSGSGKSSLVAETLARALVRRLGGVAPKPGPHRSLRGVSQIDRLVEIDQSPIGRTPRSNPATYTGLFDEIRKVFAGTRQARQHGYKVGRFSFNVKGGRCEACQGQGVQKIEMHFLPDLYVTCEACGGARFNRQTLQVHYRDKTIADVLAMRVGEAVEFFESFPAIHRLVSSLQEVGLDYVTLGQPSTTLSGGEAQRVKLATELARTAAGHTLYILDEPTTGLHFDDIRRLLAVLGRLVDEGNSVLVIEHNLDVIKTADWIVDLGPEGGEAGGQIVAAGPPEKIADCAASHTGQFLRPLLGGD